MKREQSCIFAKQWGGEEAVLFEGGHPIPFFWLMLLDLDDIDAIYEKVSNAAKSNDASQIDAAVGLDKLKALTRAADRRNFVKQYYAVCLQLFDDWLYFMQISDFSDMKIYLDLYETSLNHHSPEHFAESLRRACICFDENTETWFDVSVAATCGREGQNNNKLRFSDNASFRKMNRAIYDNFDKKIHLSKKRLTPRIRQVLLFIAVIVILAILIGFFCLFKI